MTNFNYIPTNHEIIISFFDCFVRSDKKKSVSMVYIWNSFGINQESKREKKRRQEQRLYMRRKKKKNFDGHKNNIK